MNIVVLNADYTFINIVPVRKAFRLLEKGKVVVEKWSDNIIHTVDKSFNIPLVIRLRNLIQGLYKKKMSYSNKNVYIRDDFTCQYCGKENLTGNDLTVDHVLARSKGGKSTFENTVTSCQACNTYKADKLLSECKMMFIKKGWKPYTPNYIEFIKKQQRGNEYV
jgi:5-methylcytosine-specific restriction endonuclease McrA